METRLLGLHHVTALTSDVQRNVAFYRDMLGLRLVKKTVNYDRPGTYQLYYGDDRGNPGTILAFIPVEGVQPGSAGDGSATAIAFSVPKGTVEFWGERMYGLGIDVGAPEERFGEPMISFRDPDGLLLEIVADTPDGVGYGWPGGPVAPALSIRGLHSVTLTRRDISATQSELEMNLGIQAVKVEGNRKRFKAGIKHLGIWLDVLVDSTAPPTVPGPGTIDHIAFRVASDTVQQMWRDDLISVGAAATEVVDRTYFKSVYFREPGGTLLAIATDEPGFEVDEPRETLGEALKLPLWLEPQRGSVEATLAPLHG